MPMYANVGGARKEIIRFYTNIDGASREINAMYANVDGAQKMIFTSGEKFYTLPRTEGSETWERKQGNLYYIGRGFTVNPSNGTFTLEDIHFDSNIRRGEIYVDDFSESGSVLKQTTNYSTEGNTLRFDSWKLDFGSATPDAVGTAYSPDARGAFIGEDRIMYIRAEGVTFYRWREHPDDGGYWYRTFDATPDGFDASTKIII